MMFSSLKFRSAFPPHQPEILQSQSKFYKSLSLVDLTDDFFRDSLERNSPFCQRKPPVNTTNKEDFCNKEAHQPEVKTEKSEVSTTSSSSKFGLTKNLKDPINNLLRKYTKMNREETKQSLIAKEEKVPKSEIQILKKISKRKKGSISSEKSDVDENCARDLDDFLRFSRADRRYSVPNSDSEVVRVSWKFDADNLEKMVDQNETHLKPVVDLEHCLEDRAEQSITCSIYITDENGDRLPLASDHTMDINKTGLEENDDDSSRSDIEQKDGVPRPSAAENKNLIEKSVDQSENSCQGNDYNVRDRSKVGVRTSLPFSASSSSTTSGVSSGASDTQSQGSGGTDSKSDSLTPEGCRKGSQGRGSSVPSVSGSGVSSRVSKGVEISKIAGDRETTALRQEVETLRAEITKARQTILHMQERDTKRKDRYGDRSCIDRLGKPSGSTGSRLENVSLGERRPTSLVRRYAHLYAQTRLDTFDALDCLPDLRSADELKAKLLFSVVVLSFRSVTTTSALLREEIRRILQMMPPSSTGGDAAMVDNDASSSRAVELAISSYIASSVDNFDLSKNVDEVCEQIWATLYDYPSLKMSEALLQYTKDCVRISWGLVNQNPPYLLEYETRTFRKDLHVRFHTANPSSDAIKTYLWPSLVEGPGGPCVHQGIVMT